jgi:iron complex outermembrane receptor protein
LQLKYVDELPAPFNQPLITGGKIPAYVDVDLRLAWQVLPELELALLGKNLFERSRLEFSSESGAVLTEVQQAAYLRATWSF